MCGLIGSVDLPIGKAELDQIAHRGPDGEGLSCHAVGQHQVWLGHRRLAIVDLSPNGAQPMATTDGRHALVFNGEIYNHLELRRQLPADAFRGHSDTETLLHRLAAAGTRAFAELNGIFAFAWLDIEARRLYLVRDPFGVKPLYYARSARGLCFASELKPLLGLVPAEVDRDNLATLLKLRYSPSPDTLLRGVSRLRPGHMLEVALDTPGLTLREVPYVRAIEASGERLTFPAAVQRYGELFTQAVERQLMSDVEIGVLLSGGVDSAMVAAVAQRRSAAPLKAFTVGFTGAEAAGIDEIAEARVTADALGMEHHVVRIGFEDFIGTMRDCVRIVEEPLATTSVVPMRFLTMLAARQVKVVLSGQGADEPLGGYGRYQAELLAPYVPSLLARMGRGLARAAGLRSERLTRGLEALSQRDEISRFCETYAVFSDAEILALTGTPVTQAKPRLEYFYELLGCADVASPVARMMALDLRLGLADDLLLYTDKITMRSSLECRVPILDHDLVRFIESLPDEYRLRYGSTKIIHKAFARELLPAAIIDRPKKGFWSPTAAWFRDQDALRALLLDRGSRFATFFDLGAVERTLAEHARGHNRERHIFLLLCLFFWLSEYA